MLEQLFHRGLDAAGRQHRGDGGGGTGQAVDHHPGPGQALDKGADDFGALVMGVNGQDRGARLQGQGCLGIGLGAKQG